MFIHAIAALLLSMEKGRMTSRILERALLGAVMILGCVGGGAARGVEPAVLTQAAAIRALSRKEAAGALPVRIRGVVVWQTVSAQGSFVIDDGVQGIGVDYYSAVERGICKAGTVTRRECEPGALVEIEGVTDPGGFAPVILPSVVRRLGTAPLPSPHRVSAERLFSGSDDAQWGEVEGVLQGLTEPDEAGVSIASMIVDGHRCRVIVQHGRELVAASLIDAKVRVRGALAPMLNLRSEVAGLKINTMGASDFEVLKAPPADPFQGLPADLDRLLPFSPIREPYHRKVIHGVVTFAQRGEFFYLQQGDTGLRVNSTDAVVRVGDDLEVAGFVQRAHTLASFWGAVVRSRGRGGALTPLDVTAEQIIRPSARAAGQRAATADYCGRLVRIEGRLLKIKRSDQGALRSLLIESAGQTFSALPSKLETEEDSEDAQEFGPWREGATLLLTGVCELDFADGAPNDLSVRVSGFRLWLSSSENVQVLRQPSWWTPLRLHMALVGSSFVIVLGLAWIFLLRRLLRRRTGRLEEIMRSHRDTELEFTSAQRERLRLAVDLHDGIKQHLAAASFRVEAAVGHLPDSAAAAAIHLGSAHHTLLRIQTELEECLWGLHAVEEGPPDFVQLLHHVIASAEQWPKKAVHLKRQGTPRHLPRDVAGSLLLLFKEACSNAFRHGHATRIDVTVFFGQEAFELCIGDDGRGFDPRSVPGPRAGHFGIEGMKHRMNWLRGTLQINRQAGGGMEITARLPWSAVHNAGLLEMAGAGPGATGQIRKFL